MSSPTQTRDPDLTSNSGSNPDPDPNSNNANMPTLRSQGEFYMTGIIPVAATDSTCSICFEPLTDDVVLVRACGHYFHCVCVYAWFGGQGDNHATCPNCRTTLYEHQPLEASQTEAQRLMEAVQEYVSRRYGDERLQQAMVEGLERRGYRVALRTPVQTPLQTPQQGVATSTGTPRPPREFSLSPTLPAPANRATPANTRLNREPSPDTAFTGADERYDEETVDPIRYAAHQLHEARYAAGLSPEPEWSFAHLTSNSPPRSLSASEPESQHESEDSEMPPDDHGGLTDLQETDTLNRWGDESSTASSPVSLLTDLDETEMMLDDNDVLHEHGDVEMDSDDEWSDSSTIIANDEEDSGHNGAESNTSDVSDVESSEAGGDDGDEETLDDNNGEGNEVDESSDDEESSSEYIPDSGENSGSKNDAPKGKDKRKDSKASLAARKIRSAQSTEDTAKKPVATRLQRGTRQKDSLSFLDDYSPRQRH